MLNGQRTLVPKTSEEIRDHNKGIDLCRVLHNFMINQSRKSKQFFRALLKQPRVAALIKESGDLANKWHTKQPTPEKAVFDRMQRIRSFEFAQQELGKLEEDMPENIY
jgi:hypothetical protein